MLLRLVGGSAGCATHVSFGIYRVDDTTPAALRDNLGVGYYSNQLIRSSYGNVPSQRGYCMDNVLHCSELDFLHTLIVKTCVSAADQVIDPRVHHCHKFDGHGCVEPRLGPGTDVGHGCKRIRLSWMGWTLKWVQTCVITADSTACACGVFNGRLIWPSRRTKQEKGGRS